MKLKYQRKGIIRSLKNSGVTTEGMKQPLVQCVKTN